MVTLALWNNSNSHISEIVAPINNDMFTHKLAMVKWCRTL